jgi:hypothetical protein
MLLGLLLLACERCRAGEHFSDQKPLFEVLPIGPIAGDAHQIHDSISSARSE